MYHVYAAQDLHHQHVADLASQVDFGRRTATRRSDPGTASIASRLVARLRSVLSHRPHHGTPALGS